MRYLKEAILKNKYLVVFYIVAGMAGSFLINVKADCFQQVIDGLADRTLTVDVLFWYGGIVVVHYALSYLDEYPGKKLEQGIFLEFKLFALEKISRIQYSQYQKLGMGKLTQQIENGAQAGKSILCDFWFCAIRELVPTMVFSVYFIWKISCSIACIILCGYVGVFLVTGVLLKVLYQMKEKLLSHEEDLNHFLVRGIMEMVVFRVERQFSGEIKKARSAKEKNCKN